jgi:hypothetical protein
MGRQRAVIASLMAAVCAAAIYRFHVQPWMYTWGTDGREADEPLPGDDAVGAAVPRTTRAITIDASAEEVWPWLAQIGEDRGGFYSYAWLERAVGADIHNADAVHPEWQDPHVGDTVWLARRFGPSARQLVAEVEPFSHLVLVSPADFDRLQCGEKASGAWTFAVRKQSGWCRLLIRGSGGAVGHPWFDIPHFVMERKMMLGIRKRAQELRSESVLDAANVRPQVRRRVTEARLP